MCSFATPIVTLTIYDRGLFDNTLQKICIKIKLALRNFPERNIPKRNNPKRNNPETLNVKIPKSPSPNLVPFPLT